MYADNHVSTTSQLLFTRAKALVAASTLEDTLYSDTIALTVAL